MAEDIVRIRIVVDMIDSLVLLRNAIDDRRIVESTDRTEKSLGLRRGETPVTASQFGSPGWANARMFCPTQRDDSEPTDLDCATSGGIKGGVCEIS